MAKFLLVVFLISIKIIITVFSDQHERRLYEQLLENYYPYERPIENNTVNPIVAVYLRIFLIQIIDVVIMSVWTKTFKNLVQSILG